MPIEIVERPDPLSEQSFSLDPLREPVLADSAAAQLLRQEMRRYCQGRISGRSFLIAGHRGAGKSTLVAKCFLDLWRESERNQPMLRPLLVPLHGPSLFPDPALLEAKKRATASDTVPPGGTSVAQIALEQITLGLHRAVASEFALRIAKRMGSGTLREASAQFALELYDSPCPQRLRQLWELAGALEAGVLFRADPPHLALFDLAPDGQGSRELLALTGALEAYRRISGEYTRTDSEKRVAEQLQKVQAGGTGEPTVGPAVGLVAPIASLLTGGAVGFGLSTTEASPVGIALGAIVAVLGATTVFKYATIRSHDHARTSENKFVFDLSVATLDRVLPILIQRLLLAGLAPIFIVDELDKVDLLPDRILTIVHHLKKLVAEKAFFCFLTDRGYFETLAGLRARSTYDLSYSYYSHRLLIAYRTEDLDAYLERKLQVAEAGTTPKPTPADEETSAAAARRLEREQVQAPDSRDRSVLRWALRHQSQLHMLALERALLSLRTEGGMVALAQGEIRSVRRYRIDTTFQVAIEYVLETATEEWLRHDPDRRQLLHDAAYYLTRRWLDGGVEVDLSWSGRDTFETYLGKRSNRHEATNETSEGGAQAAPPNVCADDADFLFARVGEIASFLSDEPKAEGEARSPQEISLDQWAARRRDQGRVPLAQEVRDALLIDDASILIRGGPGRYRWRYHHSGEARVDPARPAATASPSSSSRTGAEDTTRLPPGGPAAQAEPEWTADVEYVEHFSALLHGLASAHDLAAWLQRPTGEFKTDRAMAPLALRDPTAALGFTALGAQFRIFATSPEWTFVQQAMMRLRGNPSSAAASEDVHQVREFRRLLERNAGRIVAALTCAQYLGAATRGAVVLKDRLTIALDTLSRGLRFAERNETEVGAALSALLRRLGERHPRSFAVDPVSADVSAVEVTLRAALATADETAPQDVARDASIRDAAWNDARVRTLRWAALREVLDPSPEELLAEGSKFGPGAYLRIDPRAMTLPDWTRALVRALESAPDHVDPAPPWLALLALAQLGFADHAQARAIVDAMDATRDPRFASAIEEILASYGAWHGRGATPPLILIRQDRTSLADGWLPVPGEFILTPTRSEYAKLREADLYRLLEPICAQAWMALEIDPAHEATSQASALDVPTPPISVYRSEPASVPAGPYVVAPQTASDLLEAARIKLTHDRKLSASP